MKRLVALIVALLFGVGPSWTYAHLARTPHLACIDDDGEWVHVEASATRAAPDLQSRLKQASGGESHAHNHCLSNAFQHRRSLVLNGPLSVALLPCNTYERSLPFEIDSRESRIPLFRIAPKTSPPA